MFPAFSTSDLLFLSGVSLDRLEPEPLDIDRTKPIGHARLWGMKTQIFARRVTEQGQTEVVAESAAGFRWMKPEAVTLDGQPEEFCRNLQKTDRVFNEFTA